jgi:hypothetical protein
LADAEDGTVIQVGNGHTEALTAPLIIDRAVTIEGPAGPGAPARLAGEETIIIASGRAKDAVVLRHLSFEIIGVPALVIAGGCTVERCTIEGAETGIEVAAHAGSAVKVQRCAVRKCRVGVSLAGGAEAELDGSHIELCTLGVSVTGLQIQEGWNPILGSLAKANFVSNTDADLTLRAWSILEKGTEVIRNAAPDGEVIVKGWPAEACNVVAPTESGAVVLLFKGGNVNATLFQDDEDGGDGEEADDVAANPGQSFTEMSPVRDSAEAGQAADAN